MTAWDDPSSCWRTTDECARYLRFVTETGEPNRVEARRYLDGLGVASCKRGRVVLYRKSAVESALVDRRRSA